MNKSSGIEDMGGVNGYLLLCLLCAQTLTFICVYQGVKTSSNVVYVTATAPIIILIILMFKGLTLPGSFNGLFYLFYPDFTKIFEY